MDEFKIIDVDKWHRKDLYKLYTEVWTTVCYTLNFRVDVTRLVKVCRERGVKFVPSLIYAASRSVNSIDEFRYGIKDGALGIWNKLHPLYPVLNTNFDTTYHCVGADENFGVFYSSYMNESKANTDKCGAFAGDIPPNYFIISIIPFMNFESLSFDYRNAKHYYAPLIGIGKYSGREKLLAPLSVTVNHAVMDGWHVNKFFEDFQSRLEKADEWCRL